MVETGETDFTAIEVPGDPTSHLSASAMEQLREVARQGRAPEELLRMDDLDLLDSLSLLQNGHSTRAGLHLAGKKEAIQEQDEERCRLHIWIDIRLSAS